MSSRRKSSVAQYPAPHHDDGAYNGEVVEAQVITADDYFGNYDEKEKMRAMGYGNGNAHQDDNMTMASSTSSSAYSLQNGGSPGRRASTQSSVPMSSSSSSVGPSSARRASAAAPTLNSNNFASSSGSFHSNNIRNSQPFGSILEAPAEMAGPVETTPFQFKQWPAKLRQNIVDTFSRPLNERRGREFMTQHHWPAGLQTGLIKSCTKYPLRYFIVDDSGSMSTNDGRRVAGNGAQSKVIQCTRWAELVSGLNFHVELAEKLGVVSEVRILNGADPCIVGLGDDDDGESLRFAQNAFNDSPGGQTPLCSHICAVVDSLTSIADDLRRANKKAVVIICTDGEATDGDVAVAMRPLKSLPVWVVLRLCTGEKAVIDYWNDIDQQLELELDVIDDMVSEANEVKQFNSWLTYGEPLQRYREFGAFLKELDLVDEQALSGDQLKVICGSLFYERDANSFPHPNVDWRQFAQAVRQGNDREGRVFCCATQSLQPWIVLEKAAKAYGAPQSSVCTIC